MTDERLINLALTLPLIAALLTGLTGKRPNLREFCTLLCSTVLFLVIATLAPRVFAGERPAVSLFEVVPGLAIAFEIEPLGMLFALVASGLWVLTTCYSIGYMRAHRESHQTRFFTCFAIAIFAVIGAAFAKNLFALFLFYEVLTFSTYPLVTHHGDEKARLGGRSYLGILLFTSVTFLLLAIAWTWTIAGTLDFQPGGILAGKTSRGVLAILLALYVFGTGKAALMPFHRWLPAAMVAPTPVSALLHAVAVVKVGVFTVMKICVYTFGTTLLKETGISTWLMYVATHKTQISDMRGIGRQMPVTLSAFLLGSLSVIGLPPFGGSWSKWFLGLGAAEAQQPLLMAALMISSLLNIAYLMPIVVRGFFFTPQDSAERPGIQEAPLFCLVPLCVTAAGGIALFLCADRVYHWLIPIAPLLPH